jgi:hypothetical protein
VPFLASWNGVRWVTFGDQNPPDGPVRVLKVLSIGGAERLGVGGDFTSIGPFTTPGSANRIAFFTAAMGWETCGTGTNGSVLALEVFVDTSDTAHSGEQLFAAGSFSSAGGVPLNNIARWHDGSWSALEPGWFSGTSGPVRTLRAMQVSGEFNERLFVGGDFVFAGSDAQFVANNIASWRFSDKFQGLQTNGLAGTNGPVDALIASTDGLRLFVGGDFDSAAAVANTSRAAAWDGVSWQALSQGTNNRVAAFTLGPEGESSKIYAGGRFQRVGDGTSARKPVVAKLVAKWAGDVWTPLGTPETQLGSPLMVEEQMVRGMAERLFTCPGDSPDFQPRITRGHLRGPQILEVVQAISPWEFQVHVPAADLPVAARTDPAAWERYTVFFAISDDRDFRRSDNRSFEGGPVHGYLSPLTSNVRRRQ